MDQIFTLDQILYNFCTNCNKLPCTCRGDIQLTTLRALLGAAASYLSCQRKQILLLCATCHVSFVPNHFLCSLKEGVWLMALLLNLYTRSMWYKRHQNLTDFIAELLIPSAVSQFVSLWQRKEKKPKQSVLLLNCKERSWQLNLWLFSSGLFPDVTHKVRADKWRLGFKSTECGL